MPQDPFAPYRVQTGSGSDPFAPYRTPASARDEGLLSKAIRWLTPIDELSSPKKAIESGALETLGGVAGGMLGGIPGAMAGAGIVRGIRGIAQEEPPGEIAMNAAGHAALESLPVVGKMMKATGRNLVRGVLPIAEEEAEQVGKGLRNRGVTELVNRAIDAPGLRLSRTADRMGQRMKALGSEREGLVQAATEAGQRVPSQPILDAGENLLAPGGAIRESITTPATDSGARGVLDRFRQRVTRDVPLTDREIVEAYRSKAVMRPDFKFSREVLEDLTPSEADAILRNTKFFDGAKDVPGAETMGRALRSETSTQLKGSVEGLGRVMRQQEELIPTHRILDRAQAMRGSALKPEAIISGGKSRIFSVIPAPRELVFPIGKGVARAGKAADSPVLSAAARAILMQLLQEQGAQKR